MSWLTKYIINPVKNAVEGDPAASSDAATAAASVATGTHAALSASTTAIDPLMDELTSGVEALFDNFLAKSSEGRAATPAANFALTLAAQAAKAAVDQKVAALTAQPTLAAA